MTRKDSMYKNLAGLKEAHGKSSSLILTDINPNLSLGNEHFKFLPQTFIIPDNLNALQTEMSTNPEQLWIVKPVNSSSGSGIFVT